MQILLVNVIRDYSVGIADLDEIAKRSLFLWQEESSASESEPKNDRA